MENPDMDWLADIEARLETLWLDVKRRRGSFADMPCEPGEDFDFDVTAPSEVLALAAIERWIDGDSIPSLPPAATQYLRTYVACAFALIGRLREMPTSHTHPGSLPRSFLRWLLLDVSADTTQVALDDMRAGLRSGLSDGSGDPATPQ